MNRNRVGDNMLPQRPGQFFHNDFGERKPGIGPPAAEGDENLRVMRLMTCPARRCRTVLNNRAGFA